MYYEKVTSACFFQDDLFQTQHFFQTLDRVFEFRSVSGLRFYPSIAIELFSPFTILRFFVTVQSKLVLNSLNGPALGEPHFTC